MNKQQLAEEELKRALLLMKYDNRQTLSENLDKVTIKEEENTDLKNQILTEGNIVTDEDLLGSTNWFRSYIQQSHDYTIWGLVGNPVDIFAGRRKGVKGVVDAMDGWVDTSDLVYVLSIIESLKGKCYKDEAQDPPVTVPAIERFLELYKEDEGEDLVSDIEDVGTSTLKTGAEKLKQTIINKISSLQLQTCGYVDPTPEEDDKDKDKDKDKKTTYKECDFPLIKGCKGDKVKKVQSCLGITDDGIFGSGTEKAVENAGYGKDISQEDYNKIIEKCDKKEEEPIPASYLYSV